MRFRRVVSGLFLGLACSAGARAQQPAQGYFDIRPGGTSKAQVELRLGEPARRVNEPDLAYEYPPPKEDPDSARLVITFDGDTLLVSRVDAYLKAPIAPAVLRDRLGTRVITRDRADGGREELFFPQLQGLMFASRGQDAPAAAISFLSPRTLGWMYVRRFDDLLARSAFEEARTEADKAVLVDPDGGEGYHAQGRLFVALKDYDEALVRFTAASSAKYGAIDRYQAHMWMGDVYARYKNAPDKARASFLRGIEVAPPASRSEAHARFGEFLQSQKQSDEAFAEFTKALESNPNNLTAHSGLSDIQWSRKEYVKGLPHFEAICKHADQMPGDARRFQYFRCGFGLYEAGKKAEARDAYEKALRLDPKSWDSMNNLGLIYAESGNPAKAIELYRSGLEINPKDLGLNRNLASALLDTGLASDARKQAELTLSYKPDDNKTMVIYARSVAALKKKDLAVQWLGRAVAAGYADKKALTTDPLFASIQNDGDFKKLLQQMK